jgi:hypothetical protein
MTRHLRLAADPGRIVANRDVAVGELQIALFNATEGYFSEPTVLLAASTPSPGWRRQYVEISHGGRVHVVRTPVRKSTLGRTATILDDTDGGSVEIQLHDPDQWLVSCGDQDLELGDNLAVLGNEIIQFGKATPLGAGRFHLTRLVRDREGTGSAPMSHIQGEAFALIEPGALEPITLRAWAPASPVRASALNGTAEYSIVPTFKGRPPSMPRQRL